jgi:hypothetical protein
VEESDSCQFEVLPKHSSGGTEENYETPQIVGIRLGF